MTSDTLTSTPRKAAAVTFLRMVVSGKIREAYEKYIDADVRHHNPYCEAGRQPLMAAMQENHDQFPNKVIDVQRVLENGDLVAVHSRLVFNPGVPEIAVVHIFRFEGDLVVELWDIGQQAPANSPNENSMF